MAREAEAALSISDRRIAVTEAARRQIRSRYPRNLKANSTSFPTASMPPDCVRTAQAPKPRGDGRILVTYIGTVYGSTEPTSLVEAIAIAAARDQIPIQAPLHRPHRGTALPRGASRTGEMVELWALFRSTKLWPQ